MSGYSAPENAGGQLLSWLVGGAVLALALALIRVGDVESPARVGRGVAAPNFQLERLEAPGLVSLADFRGRVVLLNFWATWCKPCEDEMPSMERLYRQLHPAGFELVAVSVDEDASDVEAFRDRMGISFTIALDPRQEVSRLYQTTGFPESVLIDREGQILERYVGPRNWAVYRERIQSLVASEG
jgi:peroxiredoxin